MGWELCLGALFVRFQLSRSTSIPRSRHKKPSLLPVPVASSMHAMLLAYVALCYWLHFYMLSRFLEMS